LAKAIAIKIRMISVNLSAAATRCRWLSRTT